MTGLLVAGGKVIKNRPLIMDGTDPDVFTRAILDRFPQLKKNQARAAVRIWFCDSKDFSKRWRPLAGDKGDKVEISYESVLEAIGEMLQRG